jgi:hypothetical protein
MLAPLVECMLFSFEMIPETNQTNDMSASNSESNGTERALGQRLASAMSPCDGGEGSEWASFKWVGHQVKDSSYMMTSDQFIINL